SLEKEHQRSIAMLRQNEGFTKVVQSAEGARNTLPLGVGSLVPLLSESRLHVTSEKIRHNTPVRADPRATTTLERDSFNFLTQQRRGISSSRVRKYGPDGPAEPIPLLAGGVDAPSIKWIRSE